MNSLSLIQDNKEENDKEKQDLFELTITQEAEIQRLKMLNANIEKDNHTIRNKLKTLEEKVELFNIGNKSFNEAQNLLSKMSIENIELKSDIDEYKLEKENLINELKFLKETFSDQLNNYKNKLELNEEKLKELSVLKVQNTKLNNKLKEYSVAQVKTQNNFNEYDNHLNEKVMTLISEKEQLTENLNKVKAELLKEREKVREFEYEKKKTDIENKLTFTMSQNNFFDSNRKNSTNLFNNQSEVKPFAINKNEDVDDSFIIEIDKMNNNYNLLKFDTQQYDDKLEYLKINKQQIEEIHGLTEENNKLIKEKDIIESFLSKETQLKEKYLLDKEKLELDLSKLELQNQKLEMMLQKNQFIEESLESKDLSHKVEIENMIKKIDKLDRENKSLTQEKEKLIKEIKDSTKKKSFKLQKDNNKAFESNVITELSCLKKENDRLKEENNKISIDVNNYIEKNKEYSEEILKLSMQINDMISKEQYDKLKSLYDKLKLNVLSEHELISSNLYEFTTLVYDLKNQFIKRDNGNEQGSNENNNEDDDEYNY